MNRKIIVLLSLLVYFINAEASANENFHVVVKGGISLGSYESGLNWALLDFINSTEQQNSLISFSGASAGSINSILSAIEYCQGETVGNPVENIFFNSWDIDLSKLLRDGKVSDALFSRSALDEKVNALEQKLAATATRACDIAITMSVTRFKPHRRNFANTGHEITLQRFVVPLRVVAKDKNEAIRFENIYSASVAKFDDIPSVYIHLPENDDNSVSFESVKEVAYASSAFPVAFSPREIFYCLSTMSNASDHCVKKDQGNPVELAKFSDGGLFDNSPIGVAIDIVKNRQVFSRAVSQNQERDDNNERTKTLNTILYINPDNYRPALTSTKCGDDLDSSSADKINDAGFVEYGEYFYQSFANATSFELQKALTEIENDKSNQQRLVTTSRYHHLLADFHAHFGAFYSHDFRLHDYIVGIYDGLSTIAYMNCGATKATRECMQTNLKQQIDRIFSEKSLTTNPNNKRYYDFMLYLYNEEYLGKFQPSPGNQLVALNMAFTKTVNTSSKDSCKNVSLPAYLRNLEQLKDSELFRGAVFTPDSESLLSDYDSWQADKLTYAVENITAMQGCVNCDRANKSIGDAIKSSQSIIEAVLVHMDEGVWPQSWDPVKKWKSTLGVYFGYDLKEASNDIGLKLRIPFSRYKISLDPSINWHYMSTRSEYDHYWSSSAALVYHSQSGNSLAFPTVGLGYEYSRPSELYQSSDRAIFVSAGFFSEILNLKLGHRYSDVNSNQNSLIRSENQLLISLELVKLIRIATKQ